MLFRALKEWFRWKATLSWSLFGFLLGASTGSEFSIYVLLTLVCLLIGQGFIAHILNDIIDYKVDKIAKIKETKRSLKPLVEGWVTIKQAKILLGFFITILVITSAAVVSYYGFTILIFGLILFILILSYNVFKLGWMPFAEWSTVFPTVLIVTLIGAYVTNHDIIFKLSFLSYTFFAMSWFIVSRLCDYNADKKLGKVTTAVYLGVEKSISLSYIYTVLAVLTIYLDIILSGATFYGSYIKFLGLAIIIITSFKATTDLHNTLRFDEEIERVAGLWRTRLIYISYIYATCLICSELV